VRRVGEVRSRDQGLQTLDSRLLHPLPDSDSRAKNNPVTPEILKQVKSIELRTRGLVGSLFAGEYRSVFRGRGWSLRKSAPTSTATISGRSTGMSRPGWRALRQDLH
jgi:hypothetical protein